MILENLLLSLVVILVIYAIGKYGRKNPKQKTGKKVIVIYGPGKSGKTGLF